MPADRAFEDLRRDLPLHSVAGVRFGVLRAASRIGASFSEGTWLDRRLLSRPTCRAFRQIRVLAERAVNAAIEAQEGDAVIADRATGPAPYVLDALGAHPGATALICDYRVMRLERR